MKISKKHCRNLQAIYENFQKNIVEIYTTPIREKKFIKLEIYSCHFSKNGKRKLHSKWWHINRKECFIRDLLVKRDWCQVPTSSCFLFFFVLNSYMKSNLHAFVKWWGKKLTIRKENRFQIPPKTYNIRNILLIGLEYGTNFIECDNEEIMQLYLVKYKTHYSWWYINIYMYNSRYKHPQTFCFLYKYLLKVDHKFTIHITSQLFLVALIPLTSLIPASTNILFFVYVWRVRNIIDE